MFQSVRKKLPAVDYVSIVRSLYSDPRSMVYGALAAMICSVAAGVKTGSILLFGVAIAFVVVGLLRHIDMVSFAKSNLAVDDAEEAARWELRFTIGGVAIALIHGIWCVVSFYIVDDSFARISSITVTIAALVGVAARNYGVDRLVALQSLLMATPIAFGLFVVGDIYHTLLAVCLIPFFASMRRIAGNVRQILLNAVHGRVDASRLANELDTALSTMPHGLCMLDEDGCVAVVNRQAQFGFLGEEPEIYIGRKFTGILAEIREAGTLTAATADYLELEIAQGAHSKLVIGLADGRQCEVTINTRQGRTVLMMEDITERVLAAERINFMARYDGLTQLSNRSFFSEQVEARLKERHAANDDDTVMMMIVDIDDFKHVNDTLGHPVGDALLVEAADRIKNIFGDDAMVARFGGDEFTIFRAKGANEANAKKAAKAILAALKAPIKARDEVLTVNASVGFVLASGVDSELDSLLTRADLALYKAKGSGKAKYCVFHEKMDMEYRQRQRLKSDLAMALANDELYLLFQPIVGLGTRKIVGCEALVRWQHKELGLIPPMQFIPIAEEIGVMSEISRWVLEAAAKECMNWPKDMSISVNLSAIDFRDGDVEEMVDNALAKSGLAPKRLTVEITETTIIEELDGATKALTGVRKRGVEVALDDFGTGYSSLSYLHTLPFTKLKIDRSFVIGVVGNERSQRLLSNIARLSKDLDLTVTVEGIETEEQLRVISETADVDFAQGYLFGAPLPRKEVIELVARVAPPRVATRRKKRRTA